MASSDDKGGAEKYNNLSEEELRQECEKRELDLDGVSSKEDFIALLLKDDNKPTDWGMVYGRLLDAGLRYDEIPKRTLPQIEALLGEWANLIQIKMPANLLGGFGGVPSVASMGNGKNDSQEDVDSFFNSF